MTKLIAVILGLLMWTALFVLIHQAASAQDSNQRTITVLSGRTAHYAVVRHPAGLVLDLMLRVDDYEQLEAFLRCPRGCRLRVYIVQERKQ